MSTKAWFLDNLKVVRGIELLTGFKMSPGSPICRTYTSCCYTSVIDFGNAKMPRWRTFNRNTIKNAGNIGADDWLLESGCGRSLNLETATRSRMQVKFRCFCSVFDIG